MSFKESRKQAAIATLGALGSGLGQPGSFRRSSISPKDISAKPNPPKRLGQRENNRFLAQTELLKGPLSANVNKVASFDDVTPYISSSYVKKPAISVPAYTEQPYTNHSGDVSTTKQADLSGLASMLQSYAPQASNKIMDASKNLYSAFTNGFKLPEGQGNIFSNLGKQVSDAATGLKGSVATGIDKLRSLISSKPSAISTSSALTQAPTPAPTPAPVIPNSAQAGEANRNLSDSINNATIRARAQDFVRQTTPQAPAVLPEMMGPPSSLATKQPAPATISRASMFGSAVTPKPQSSSQLFPTSEEAAKNNKSLSDTLNVINNRAGAQAGADKLNEQYNQFLASGAPAPLQSSPPANKPAEPDIAPVIKYKTNEELTNAARKADLAARAVNSGLGAENAGRPDLAQAIKGHINKWRSPDLNDLPADTRASFDRLSEKDKTDITNQLVINAKHKASLSGGATYDPVFGTAKTDEGIISAADAIYNGATNVPKWVLSKVPGMDPELAKPTQLISDTDSIRASINTAAKVDKLDQAIKKLDTQMGYDRAKGLDTSGTERKLHSLMDMRDNEQAIDAYTDRTKLMPLSDPNKGIGDKGLETLGDTFSTLALPITALRGGLRFGLNAAEVPNADAWADVSGLSVPSTVRSIPSLIRALKASPAAVANAVRNPRSVINAATNSAKNVNLYNAMKAAPGKALDVATANPTMVAAGIADILNNPDQPLPSSNPDTYPVPPATPAAAAANPSTPAAANFPGLTQLQQLLIAGGISVPAAIALSKTMGPRNSDELPDDELPEDEEE